MKTTPEQQRKLLDKCRSSPNWREIQPELLYLPLIKYGVLKIDRRRGKAPLLVWL